MGFHIGQRVVCIDDKPRPPSISYQQDAKVTKGSIYTVRGIYNAVPRSIVGILLEEVTGILSPKWNIEIGFCSTRFRPVRETNIDVFTKMLEKEPIGA